MSSRSRERRRSWRSLTSCSRSFKTKFLSSSCSLRDFKTSRKVSTTVLLVSPPWKQRIFFRFHSEIKQRKLFQDRWEVFRFVGLVVEQLRCKFWWIVLCFRLVVRVVRWESEWNPIDSCFCISFQLTSRSTWRSFGWFDRSFSSSLKWTNIYEFQQISPWKIYSNSPFSFT